MENLLQEKISSPPGLARLALVSDIKDVDDRINANTKDIQEIELAFEQKVELDRANLNQINQNFILIDNDIKNVLKPQIQNNAIDIDRVNSEIDELKNSVSDGKKKVAAAITSKGIYTSATDNFDTMATNISNIQSSSLGSDTSDGTITPDDVLSGKIGYSQGSKITGTMPNRGSVSYNLPINGTYTIAKGYHDGTGKITQNVTNRGAISYTLPINGTYTIPEGYHNGSGKVTQSVAVNNSSSTVYIFSNRGTYRISSNTYYSTGFNVEARMTNLLEYNIKKGVNVGGVIGTYEGADLTLGSTMSYYSDTTNILTSNSYTPPGVGSKKICTYTLRAQYYDPNQGANYTQTFVAASPGLAYMSSLQDIGTIFVCENVYNETFGSKLYYGGRLNIYPPNVTINSSGNTLTFTWPRGKSSYLQAMWISYGCI